MAVAHPDPRYKDELRTRAAKLYRQGLTVEQIAEQLRVSKGRAYIYLLDSGIKLRPRGPKSP